MFVPSLNELFEIVFGDVHGGGGWCFAAQPFMIQTLFSGHPCAVKYLDKDPVSGLISEKKTDVHCIRTNPKLVQTKHLLVRK